MENSFFKYSQTEIKENLKKQEQKKEKVKIKKSERMNIEDIYNQYKDLNQDALLENLKSEIEKRKTMGTFNVENLIKVIDEMGAYLTMEQKNNMKRLLKEIDEKQN